MATKLKLGTVGSVSCGTCRTQDLLEALLAELTALEHPEPDGSTLAEIRSRVECGYTTACDEWGDCDDLACLFDMLDEHAPSGCYFGAHPGDGADYGFWPFEGEGSEAMSDAELADRISAHLEADRAADASRDEAERRAAEPVVYVYAEHCACRGVVQPQPEGEDCESDDYVGLTPDAARAWAARPFTAQEAYTHQAGRAALAWLGEE